MGLRYRLERLIERTAGEAAVALAARLAPSVAEPPAEPPSILVLRNNDLGDVLVATPLFEALRRRFPRAQIVAAVGRWSLPLLAGNPHLSEVLAVDAPWINKFVRPQGPWRAAAFIARSEAARELARRRFAVGIDVAGSVWGSLLLLRAGIPFRLGVRGYAGGHSGVQRRVEYDPDEHVARSALRFAELLGAGELPECRPQVFLDPAERATGEQCWLGLFGPRRPGVARVALGPGGGLAARSWPAERWAALVEALAARSGFAVAVAGGPDWREPGERLAARSPAAQSLAGHLSLRETLAVVAAADLVVSNSSMLMHAAAAFSRPTVVLLGDSFSSARAHDRQWGYPGTCRSLGREPGERRSIASPDEAMVAIEEVLAQPAPAERPR
jgi:heptosyltransferase-2